MSRHVYEPDEGVRPNGPCGYCGRLADDTEGLAPPQCERHAIDGLDDALARVEVRVQIADRQHGRRG